MIMIQALKIVIQAALKKMKYGIKINNINDESIIETIKEKLSKLAKEY